MAPSDARAESSEMCVKTRARAVHGDVVRALEGAVFVFL